VARQAGAVRYLSTVPCKNGHIGERWTVGNGCIACAQSAEGRAKKSAYLKAYNRRKALLRPARPLSPREAALQAGEPRYWSDKPCKRGHVGERSTASAHCLACAGREERKAKNRARQKAFRAGLGPEERKAYYEKGRSQNDKIARKAYMTVYLKKWRLEQQAKNPDWQKEQNAYLRRRRAENPDWRIKHAARTLRRVRGNIQAWLQARLRSRLHNALENNTRRGSAVRDLGCTIAELKVHLEAQFTAGMTWESRGEWHIDHVRPLSSFDLTDRAQLLKARHFTNLQPLWGPDNLSKGARWV
jgi:hypothetical protein